MMTTTVSVADVLFGQATPTESSLRNEIIALITLQRVAVNTLAYIISSTANSPRS